MRPNAFIWRDFTDKDSVKGLEFSMNSKRKMKSTEIDLLAILSNVWKKKLIIILACIIGALGMYLRAEYLLTPTYTASVTMYANNSSNSGESDKVSGSDLSTSIKLVSACGAIIKSDPVLEQVRIDLGYPPVGAVSVYAVNETQVFKIDVTATNPDDAVKFANRIAEVAPVKIAEIIEGSSIKLISNAKYAWKNWPVKKTEAIKGAVIGFAASLFAVCIITLLDTRIKKEDDLERWDYPILGVIPSFTSAQKGGAYASDSKGGNK